MNNTKTNSTADIANNNDQTSSSSRGTSVPPQKRRYNKVRHSYRSRCRRFTRPKQRGARSYTPATTASSSSEGTIPPTTTITTPQLNNTPVVVQENNNSEENRKNGEVRGKRNFVVEENVRSAISTLYKFNHYHKHCNNPQSIHNIVDLLYNCFDKKVTKRVIRLVCSRSKEAFDAGQEYDPSVQKYSKPEKIKIKKGSKEEHVMTVLKERTSYETATHLYNLLMVEEGEQESKIGIKALYNAVQRTIHTRRVTQKISQASNDRLFWKQARHCYCAQYLARLGVTLSDETISRLQSVNEDIRSYTYDDIRHRGMDIESIYAIAFWDELHIEQVAGVDRVESITFPRNDDGIYDEERGRDEKEKVSL